jgi:hypothetical protein
MLQIGVSFISEITSSSFLSKEIIRCMQRNWFKIKIAQHLTLTEDRMYAFKRSWKKSLLQFPHSDTGVLQSSEKLPKSKRNNFFKFTHEMFALFLAIWHV